ncbi:hypothetical protein C731_2967 [Mycolicibacterium hassiacum DSM 44199]|uniref:Uncharacterized protein n=2 Tax=Mycolicibacterium hassiacum TaxID=46351 RepID=K5BJG4_MYCHD|nr:hypothetical protein [Mycolicibacterium hassiacum]EKF23069.1 hypothetical protein C731_2967 [Mycolicibacterium hassiacum DSM 44199]MDA4086049.1 hypothetical protein [Mycolicibacterium hassiacum DSM 44199]
MPRKVSPLRQQVLAALIKTRPTAWTQKKVDLRSENPRKPELIEVVHDGSELKYPLARNVSEASVEQAAKRWLP